MPVFTAWMIFETFGTPVRSICSELWRAQERVLSKKCKKQPNYSKTIVCPGCGVRHTKKFFKRHLHASVECRDAFETGADHANEAGSPSDSSDPVLDGVATLLPARIINLYEDSKRRRESKRQEDKVKKTTDREAPVSSEIVLAANDKPALAELNSPTEPSATEESPESSHESRMEQLESLRTRLLAETQSIREGLLSESTSAKTSIYASSGHFVTGESNDECFLFYPLGKTDAEPRVIRRELVSAAHPWIDEGNDGIICLVISEYDDRNQPAYRIMCGGPEFSESAERHNRLVLLAQRILNRIDPSLTQRKCNKPVKSTSLKSLPMGSD